MIFAVCNNTALGSTLAVLSVQNQNHLAYRKETGPCKISPARSPLPLALLSRSLSSPARSPLPLALLSRVTTFALLAFSFAAAQPAAAQTTLWYNGDFNASDQQASTGALNNDATNGGPKSSIFDDFVVTNPTGWNVTNIWSNDFSLNGNSLATQAQWSIRSGMSSGNGGTILYSGVSTATQTSTGLASELSTVYTTSVSGLNLNLAQGTYWLQVSPVVSSGSGGEWYNATTNGLNAIGTPKGNDGNAFE